MSLSQIDISGLNKAAVLAALYNGSRPQGLGFLHYSSDDMTVEQAQAILDAGTTYFDYLQGRVMKIDLSGDSLETRLYDRDNGEGAAFTVIRELREQGSPSTEQIKRVHDHGRNKAAQAANGTAFAKGELTDRFLGQFISE